MMHFTLNQLLLSLNQYIYMRTHFPAFALIPKNTAFQFMLLFFPLSNENECATVVTVYQQLCACSDYIC